MVERISKLASACIRPLAGLRFLLPLLIVAAVPRSPAIQPAVRPSTPYVYEARANIVDVIRATVSTGTSPMPGAGVRAFQDPEIDEGGTERFEIRWYANPPGIPPGVVVMLETVQAHSPIVKNHILRIGKKSENHVRSVIEIPAEEVRQAGQVQKWRVRVIWRGRLLASQESTNWEG